MITDEDVEAATEAIRTSRAPNEPVEWARSDARLALDAVAPAIIRRAKAEALREAARDLQSDLDTLGYCDHAPNWLRNTADFIEAGK